MSAKTEQEKMNVFTRSWLLTKSAWHVLKLDKELLTLPLIGMAMMLGTLLISLPVILLLMIAGTSTSDGQSFTTDGPWGILVFVLMTLLMTLISSFISGAIIHGAIERFDGKDPTVRGSLVAARKKIKPLFLFSLLTSTVGLVLQMIEERVPLAGKILVWLGNVAWSVATFFALPYIMTTQEHLGPIDATKQSTALVKKVWGESLVVNVGIGLIAFLTTLLYAAAAVLFAMLTANAGNIALAIAITVEVLGFFTLILVFSVLSAIARTAVFYWATTGRAPETFDKELLRAALKPKKARKIFA